MTRWITRSDAVQATLLTSFGALLVFGAVSFPFGTALIAMALLVVSILVLMKSIQGPTWLGATLLATSVLLMVRNPVGRALGDFLVTSLPAIAGALLIALGIMRLAAPQPRARHTTVPEVVPEAT